MPCYKETSDLNFHIGTIGIVRKTGTVAELASVDFRGEYATEKKFIVAHWVVLEVFRLSRHNFRFHEKRINICLTLQSLLRTEVKWIGSKKKCRNFSQGFKQISV